MTDTTIEAAIAFIQDLFRGNAGGHDAGHSLRVYRNALRIAESEPGCDGAQAPGVLPDSGSTTACVHFRYGVGGLQCSGSAPERIIFTD